MNTLYLKRISILPSGKENYWESIPAIRALEEEDLILDTPVTILVGENGSGKTTLLEAVAQAMGFQAQGGSRHFNRENADGKSELYTQIRLARGKRPSDAYFLKAENFFQAMSYVDEIGMEAGYGGSSLLMNSHGEGFLKLVQNRFYGKGLYLLDEPEAALSPMRIMTLIVEMVRLVEKDSQFILATHSPILMAYPGAKLLKLDEDGISPVNYRDTEHYQVTKMFLDQPERMLRLLLDENRE